MTYILCHICHIVFPEANPVYSAHNKTKVKNKISDGGIKMKKREKSKKDAC